MPTEAALTLVDAIAEHASDVGLSGSTEALRAQAALVRGLFDELEHRHPSEAWVAALHAQLGEELSRLVGLLPNAPPEGSCPGGPGPLEVLVVDDDESSLRATTAAVRALGYLCRSAADADEALRQHERRPAAIVVSDWNMPKLSGLDLCRTLKGRDPRVYVILVTAFYGHADLREAVRHGIDDFLPKPLNIDDLAVRLRAAERLVRAIQTLERRKGHLRRACPRCSCDDDGLSSTTQP